MAHLLAHPKASCCQKAGASGPGRDFEDTIMNGEILIPITMFGMIAALVIAPLWLKSRERRDMQVTLRSAIEKGQPLPPELIEALSKEAVKAPPTATRDLRLGVVLLAVSIGIVLFGNAIRFIGDMEEAKAVFPIMGIAAIPGMVGLAFILLSFINKNKG